MMIFVKMVYHNFKAQMTNSKSNPKSKTLISKKLDFVIFLTIIFLKWMKKLRLILELLARIYGIFRLFLS